MPKAAQNVLFTKSQSGDMVVTRVKSMPHPSAGQTQSQLNTDNLDVRTRTLHQYILYTKRNSFVPSPEFTLFFRM